MKLVTGLSETHPSGCFPVGPIIRAVGCTIPLSSRHVGGEVRWCEESRLSTDVGLPWYETMLGGFALRLVCAKFLCSDDRIDDEQCLLEVIL